jgi:hypothetical protein
MELGREEFAKCVVEELKKQERKGGSQLHNQKLAQSACDKFCYDFPVVSSEEVAALSECLQASYKAFDLSNTEGGHSSSVALPIFPAGCVLTVKFLQGILWDAHTHTAALTPKPDELQCLSSEAFKDGNTAGVKQDLQFLGGNPSVPRSNKSQQSELCAMIFLFGFLHMLSLKKTLLGKTLSKYEPQEQRVKTSSPTKIDQEELLEMYENSMSPEVSVKGHGDNDDDLVFAAEEDPDDFVYESDTVPLIMHSVPVPPPKNQTVKTPVYTWDLLRLKLRTFACLCSYSSIGHLSEERWEELCLTQCIIQILQELSVEKVAEKGIGTQIEDDVCLMKSWNFDYGARDGASATVQEENTDCPSLQQFTDLQSLFTSLLRDRMLHMPNSIGAILPLVLKFLVPASPSRQTGDVIDSWEQKEPSIPSSSWKECSLLDILYECISSLPVQSRKRRKDATALWKHIQPYISHFCHRFSLLANQLVKNKVSPLHFC